MNSNLLDVFDCEKQCEYKGRIYIVRDNGAICRLPKEGGRISKWDNVWTFGTKNSDAYMIFTGNIRVHQVVCTAFNGPEPYPQMVVDHIDTNRCNNRPENLRWVTRLENALNNPYTRKKIEFLCGSIEAFLENPSIIRDKVLSKNLDWMRTVSKEEAAICKRNMDRWANQDSKPSSGKGIGDYVFSKEIEEKATKWNGSFLYDNHEDRDNKEVHSTEYTNVEETPSIIDSLTPGAKQKNWSTPTEFPQCPSEITSSPLQDYLIKLSKGVIYSQNKYNYSCVYAAAMAKDCSHFSVLTEISSDPTNYVLSEVTFENGEFIHESIRTFFTEEGANKYYTLSLGNEWTGGDVLEDGC